MKKWMMMLVLVVSMVWIPAAQAEESQSLRLSLEDQWQPFDEDTVVNQVLLSSLLGLVANIPVAIEARDRFTCALPLYGRPQCPQDGFEKTLLYGSFVPITTSLSVTAAGAGKGGNGKLWWTSLGAAVPTAALIGLDSLAFGTDGMPFFTATFGVPLSVAGAVLAYHWSASGPEIPVGVGITKTDGGMAGSLYMTW